MKNQAIQFKGQRVLTTRYLANLLEISSSLITSIVNKSYNFNKILKDRQFDSLTEGIDYIDLKGKERLSFVDNNRNAYLDISSRGGNFRIFTKSGVIKMSRNLTRLNLYYNKIYDYFYQEDLTEFYRKNEECFTTTFQKENKFIKYYRDNIYQSELALINKKLEELSDKVDRQEVEIAMRLSVLEESIDRILFSKFEIR